MIDRRRAIGLAARRLVAVAGLAGIALPGGALQAQPSDGVPAARGDLAAAAVQAGLAPGVAAWSGDGRWWLVADRQQPRLLLFSADGQLQRDWAVAALDGRRSQVSALQASPPRRSFVVALRDLAELWEISLDPQAEAIHDGLVHDYRMAEAIAQPGYLGLRRAPLERPLIDLRIDPTGQLVLGVGAAAGPDGHALEVIHLAVRRRIARLALDGPPDLSRLAFGIGGSGGSSGSHRPWLAVPLRPPGQVQCFDRRTWAALQADACAP